MITADLYLRLSDFRDDSEGFAGREAKLRAEAARLGWNVGRVVVENDATAAANGHTDGRSRPASAFKRRKITTPSGRVELRTVRPGFRSILDDLTAGRAGAMLGEDLDRVARDPRDLEDLIDACAARGASARSLSGSLTLTNGGTDAEITMARVMVSVANKSSRDTARRVADSREATARAGRYGGGGRRPFGYQPDPDAAAHAKTLLVVEDEALVLRQAASAVLAGVSLRFLARDLRERDVPTVTGAKWTPDSLREVLLKPSVAGLAAHTATVKANGDEPRTVTTLHPAAWPAILDRGTWEAVVAKLTDPARTTRPTGAVPKWLASGIARCHCGELVYVRSSSGRPSYVCRGPQQHLRRVAPATDEHVARYVIARLNRPDMADLLRPPVRPGIDAAKLRQDAAGLRERKAKQLRLHAAGLLDDDDLTRQLRDFKRRLAEIDATLTAHSAPDPLAEFRGADAAQVWESLSLARKRAVVALLCEITLLPGRPGAPRRFDGSTVRVEPKAA